MLVGTGCGGGVGGCVGVVGGGAGGVTGDVGPGGDEPPPPQATSDGKNNSAITNEIKRVTYKPGLLPQWCAPQAFVAFFLKSGNFIIQAI